MDAIIDVPTGKIVIMAGDKGRLEYLSIGDYGKENNLKADFLGLTEEIQGVKSTEIMPLEEKWVITISTQYGCSMGCVFCDVPSVGKGVNATMHDLSEQVRGGILLHPEVETTKRLNLHYARMGEPTFNPNIINYTKYMLREDVQLLLGNVLIHPVVSTMLPRANSNLFQFLQQWCDVKNFMFRGDAGLQLSVNSTDDAERAAMFAGNAVDWKRCVSIGRALPFPKGRKYALNFALAGYTIDADKLLQAFSPDKFMCKLTPMHLTTACKTNGIETKDGYTAYTPYKETEDALKAVGYDVIVFVPSIEEDESRITCGNAILSDE